MPFWGQMLLVNAVSATVVAVLVAVLARRIRRPAVVHLLWLVVLVELVAPPVFEVDVLQSRAVRDIASLWQRAPAGAASAEATPGDPPPALRADHPTTASTATPDRMAAPVTRDSGEAAAGTAPLLSAAVRVGRAVWRSRGSLGSVLALVLACGSIVLSTVAGVRLVRFRRTLRHAVDAPPALQQRVAALTRQFGLRRAPRLRLVPGRMPPSLWRAPTGNEILLPAALLPRLAAEETDALLAHELAHLQRRDHWLRPFELLVVTLYWWHPVAWWACRNLRRAEEQSCDALVVGTHRASPRVYAESLLKTVEFLAFRPAAVPSLATGATGAAPLKERVTMILQARTPHALPGRLRTPLMAALSLAVLVSPTWVEQASSIGPKEPDKTAQENIEHKHQQELLEIQQQELQLHREMQQLEQQRRLVQRRIDDKLLQQQLQQMNQEIAVLEREGQQAEALQLRNAMANLQHEAALQQRRAEFEQSMMQKRMQIEYELQDLSIEIQKVELAGELEKHEELMRRNFDLEQKLRRLDLEALENELQLQRQQLESESKQLEEMQ